MKCNNCGRELTDDVVFCSYCGVKIEPKKTDELSSQPPRFSVPAVKETEKKKPFFKKVWFWIAVAVIVVLVAMIAVIASGKVKITVKPAAENYSEAIAEDIEETEESSEENTEYAAGTDPEEVTEKVTEDVTVEEESIDYNFGKTEPEITEIRLGEKAVKEGAFEITFEECAIADSVSAANESESDPSIPDIDGETYVVVSAKVKNLSSEMIDFSIPFYKKFTVNGGNMGLTGYEVYGEDEYTEGLDSFMGAWVSAGEEKMLYFVCSVPDDVLESREDLELYLGFKEEISSGAFPDKEDCDCIYLLRVESQKDGQQ